MTSSTDEVLEKVQAAVEELNTSGLPDGVRLVPFYDRTHLVQSTLHTVAHSVLLGITLVVLVLVLFLGLVPASLATGLGSDVQRPLATVIVWGLFSSTTLTLFVVPTFYRIFVPALPAPETEEEDELAVASGSARPEARA